MVIIFNEWSLTVDREATLTTYASVANGSAEDCDCLDCKNYLANRDIVFPSIVKSVLNQLGIDYRKESEVWKMYKDQDGSHLYNGIFHFKGSFEGKNCEVSIPGSKGFTFDMTPINKHFSIGFRMASELTYFTDKDNLVQVEFEVKLPWVIDKKLES